MAKVIKDHNNFIEIKDNKLSSPGIYEYLGAEIGAPEPGKVYRVLRPIEELSDPKCAESFKLQPWVIGHDMLGDEDEDTRTMDAEDKGIHGIIGESVYFDPADNWLKGNIKMFTRTLKDEASSGANELSLGYKCIYDFSPGRIGGSFYRVFPGVQIGDHYDVVQKNIRGNHLASVEHSRMDVAVGDQRYTGDQAMKITIKSEHLIMDQKPKVNKKAGEGKDESITLEEVMKAVKAIQPLMETINSFMASAGGAEPKEELEETIEDEDLISDEPKEDEDKLTEDEDKEEKEKGQAMDAKAVKKMIADAVAPYKAKVAELEKAQKAMDSSVVFKEVADRDELASKISWHVGVFDHKHMTLQQVAKYGVEKLEVPCDPGQEVPAIKAYLHNRHTKPKLYTGDSASSTSEGESLIDGYINGEAK